MASHNSLALLFLTLSLISTSTTAAAAAASPSLLNAADALANSGHISMSLTLQLIAADLPLPSPTTVTIFAPPDSAFAVNGQPKLAHLLLHFSPVSVSAASLHSLPFSSTLPTLSHSKHLTITSTPLENDTNAITSINNVKISRSPIFDDGFIIVHAIDSFFDLNFKLNPAAVGNSTGICDHEFFKLKEDSIFNESAGVLKSRGHSIMASFLDLQLLGLFGSKDSVELTIFAPVDEELVQFSGNFLEYPSIFMRHVVPCKFDYTDLVGMANGTLISNFEGDFSLQITKDEDGEKLMVNGLQITSPNMYANRWLAIHGIIGLISTPVVETESSIAPNHEDV